MDADRRRISTSYCTDSPWATVQQKETRLQGLKDRLAATDEDPEELQEEIEDLEDRIEELTSFDSGRAFHTRIGGET